MSLVTSALGSRTLFRSAVLSLRGASLPVSSLIPQFNKDAVRLLSFYRPVPETASNPLATSERVPSSQIPFVGFPDLSYFVPHRHVRFLINGSMSESTDVKLAEAYFKKEYPFELLRINRESNLVVVKSVDISISESLLFDAPKVTTPLKHDSSKSPLSLYIDFLRSKNMINSKEMWIKDWDQKQVGIHSVYSELESYLDFNGVTVEAKEILCANLLSQDGNHPDAIYLANTGLWAGPISRDLHPELGGRSLMVLEYPKNPHRRNEYLRDIMFCLDNGMIPVVVTVPDGKQPVIFEGMPDLIKMNVPKPSGGAEVYAIMQKSSRSVPEHCHRVLNLLSKLGTGEIPDMDHRLVLEIKDEYRVINGKKIPLDELVYHADLSIHFKHNSDGTVDVFVAEFAYTEDSISAFKALVKDNPKMRWYPISEKDVIDKQSVNFVVLDRNFYDGGDLGVTTDKNTEVGEILKALKVPVYTDRHDWKDCMKDIDLEDVVSKVVNEDGGGNKRCKMIVGTRDSAISVDELSRLNKVMKEKFPEHIHVYSDETLRALDSLYSRHQDGITQFFERGRASLENLN